MKISLIDNDDNISSSGTVYITPLGVNKIVVEKVDGTVCKLEKSSVIHDGDILAFSGYKFLIVISGTSESSSGDSTDEYRLDSVEEGDTPDFPSKGGSSHVSSNAVGDLPWMPRLKKGTGSVTHEIPDPILEELTGFSNGPSKNMSKPLKPKSLLLETGSSDESDSDRLRKKKKLILLDEEEEEGMAWKREGKTCREIIVLDDGDDISSQESVSPLGKKKKFIIIDSEDDDEDMVLKQEEKTGKETIVLDDDDNFSLHEISRNGKNGKSNAFALGKTNANYLDMDNGELLSQLRREFEEDSQLAEKLQLEWDQDEKRKERQEREDTIRALQLQNDDVEILSDSQTPSRSPLPQSRKRRSRRCKKQHVNYAEQLEFESDSDE